MQGRTLSFVSVARESFRRIRATRAHEEVAEQIRRHIALRLVAPAGALPSERALAGLFGVGRATVQRAIAALEAEGLVERRRGRHGGTFVVGSPADGSPLERVIEALRRDRAEIEAALDFRLEVEPAAAERAARARGANDLEAIATAAEAAAAARNDAEFMEHDTAFHLAVARASRNRFFLDSVERLRVVLNDALVALPDSPAWHAWSNREHETIREAVAAGHARAARTAMLRHVRHTDASVRSLLASL